MARPSSTRSRFALRAIVLAGGFNCGVGCGGGGGPLPVDAGDDGAEGSEAGELADGADRPEADEAEPDAAEASEPSGPDDGGPEATPDAPAYDPNRFVTRIVSFTPGTAAGFGQNRLPAVLYGPPHGGGACRGSTDVLTLGAGGEIVIEFADNAVVDGPGTDFIVFENPFLIGCGDPANVYAELGEVSVSEDGMNWATFACTATSYPYGACAGWHPVYSNPQNDISPFDPAVAGGDPFDLADVGVARAKYVRVRDMKTMRDAGGFDLDAVAIVQAEHP